MMLVCIKQHLSKISSSTHEKVMQLSGWVGKKRYKNSVYIITDISHTEQNCTNNIFLHPIPEAHS